MSEQKTVSPGDNHNQIVRLTGLSNREFLEKYARPGNVGLSGGRTLIDKVITRAERRVDEAGGASRWSHAFIFEGRRLDGHHWVIESDLAMDHKHIRLGVQENRLTKYHDEELYRTLAVLDFGLGEEQVNDVLREGLELVALRTRYSLRELVGTVIALRHPRLRARENLLARESSFYCSAFVQHLFRRAGFDLSPGLEVKHTTPEDISRTPVPHTTYLLERPVPRGKLARLARHVRARARAGVRR